MREKLQKVQIKRLVILNLPYFFILWQIKDPGCTGIAWEKAWSRDLA